MLQKGSLLEHQRTGRQAVERRILALQQRRGVPRFTAHAAKRHPATHGRRQRGEGRRAADIEWSPSRPGFFR